MDNTPVIADNLFQFEVKLWHKGEPKVFENITPRLVICADNEPHTAYCDYMNFLDKEKVDTSDVLEVRVNRKGGSQGYYFHPNPRWATP
jgi:hypothetical protein